MLKPARMNRILVGGHREHMSAVIGVLHEEGVMHLEDYQDPTDITRMGRPLPAGEEASELLVRVRGLQKALDAEDAPIKAIATEDPASLVTESEEAILPVVDQLADARTTLAALEAEKAALTPYESIDINLRALLTVSSLKAYLGTVRADPRPALAGVESEVEIVKTPAGTTAVVMVRPSDAPDAERALAEAGFTATVLPDVDATPAERLVQLRTELGDARRAVDKAAEILDGVRDKAGSKLAALEAMLTAEVERTQVPLQFGVTDHTFHVEGWVPQDRLNHVQNVLAHKFGESLYVSELGDGPRGHENVAHSEDGHHHHEHEDHGHHDVAVEDEAPTQLRNKGPAGKYEFLLSLLAMPRYKELDPTKLIAIFFPIFFGLMVGDVVIGLFIVLIALWLRNNKLFGIGGDGVAKPMMWGGLWAILIGLLVFGEGLGLHFVVSDEAVAAGEHSWETAFGIHFPEEGFIHKTGGHYAAEVASGEPGAITTHAEAGTAVSNPLAPHGGAHLSVNGWFNLGYYSKIHDVQALLLISVLIGFVHLVLGLLLGVRNVAKMHGVKLAIQEKVSWLLIIGGAIAFVMGMQGHNAILQWAGAGVFVAAVALLWMGVQHTIGVGFIAILEIPSLLGNLLSYTRLAAIGASKAGMAIAFATIGFELIGGGAGLVVYFLASLLITVLAILAGFLQSLRLQFVEFFSKFYEGGGRPYVPFGRQQP